MNVVVFLFAKRGKDMKRYLIYLFLMIMMFIPQDADASSSSQIDFTITHEINMTSELGSTEIDVEPLIITNNSKCDLNVEAISVEMIDDWKLVSKNTDFEAVASNSKMISICFLGGEDLYGSNIEPFSIGRGVSKSIFLSSRMSKTSINLEKQHVANIVVEIVPAYECTTAFYEDGTLIINEISWDRESNVQNHGKVLKEYVPLGTDNKYIFLSSTGAPWYSNRRNIKKVQVGSQIKPTSMKYWFYGFTI